MHCDCFKNFEDLIFVDDKLSTKKQRKITSLANLCAYGMYNHVGFMNLLI